MSFLTPRGRWKQTFSLGQQRFQDDILFPPSKGDVYLTPKEGDVLHIRIKRIQTKDCQYLDKGLLALSQSVAYSYIKAPLFPYPPKPPNPNLKAKYSAEIFRYRDMRVFLILSELGSKSQNKGPKKAINDTLVSILYSVQGQLLFFCTRSASTILKCFSIHL